MEKRNYYLQARLSYLGVEIDLSFNAHTKRICSKDNSDKINTLRRIRRFISIEKAKLLYEAFLKSIFNYCPLIWMFCSKEYNNLINKTHKRALRVVYQENDSSLNDLLKIDNSTTVHVKNLRILMCEIYKSLYIKHQTLCF